MTFGEAWRDMRIAASQEESRQIFEAFVQAGGNFIDTANNYNAGSSEKFVGEFIAAERERFVLATKYSLTMRPGDPNSGGNQRKSMVQSLEASLRRLNTDYIDLYWLHAWDFMTPVEEVMRALDDLVRAGKILYIGISDTPAWVIAQANTLAELRGWSRFIGLQLQYSLIERNIEREHLPMARALDLAITAWGPLGRGILTGKYNQDASAEGRAKLWGPIPERNLAIAEEVIKIANEVEHTPSQVALNWVRQQPGVMIPIIGARTVAQFQDNLGCLEFTLTEAQLTRLDEMSRMALGFPYDFLASEGVRDLIYGGTFSQIDNHRR